MGELIRELIKFRMFNPAPSTHPLHFARVYDRGVTKRILVAQSSLQDHGQNFHILMAMGSKTLPALNPVFIDHPQIAKAHHLGVMILGKRKGMVRLQPTVVSIAS